MILSGAEEQSHSVLCDSDDLLHVAIYSVKGHALGLLSQGFFLSSSWNSSEDAQVGSLAWLDVICLFSALKLSLSGSCMTALSWVNAAAGLQWHACHCRTSGF